MMNDGEAPILIEKNNALLSNFTQTSTLLQANTAAKDEDAAAANV